MRATPLARRKIGERCAGVISTATFRRHPPGVPPTMGHPNRAPGPITKPCCAATNRPRLAPDLASAAHNIRLQQFSSGGSLMRRNLAWHATDTLTRAQLTMLHAL